MLRYGFQTLQYQNMDTQQRHRKIAACVVGGTWI